MEHCKRLSRLVRGLSEWSWVLTAASLLLFFYHIICLSPYSLCFFISLSLPLYFSLCVPIYNTYTNSLSPSLSLRHQKTRVYLSQYTTAPHRQKGMSSFYPQGNGMAKVRYSNRTYTYACWHFIASHLIINVTNCTVLNMITVKLHQDSFNFYFVDLILMFIFTFIFVFRTSWCHNPIRGLPLVINEI